MLQSHIADFMPNTNKLTTTIIAIIVPMQPKLHPVTSFLSCLSILPIFELLKFC